MAPEFDWSKENETVRPNRNGQELLQERPVAQTGAQILTGFLLTLSFMPGFERLSDSRRTV